MFGLFENNRTRTYIDPVEEFYRPGKGGKTVFDESIDLAARMGKDGVPVTKKFLATQASIYLSYLKGAKRTVGVKVAELQERKKDWVRPMSFGLVFLVGIAVTTMAIFVDYTILEEIWSRNFSNEFFEVPESLRSSVTFKSLQVVFAVLALHYFVSGIGKWGRGLFIGMLAAMVLTMLIGIGFLNASESLPIGSTLFGVELNGGTLDAEDELASLGLEADVEEDAAYEDEYYEEESAIPFGLTAEGYESTKTVLFFMSFGMIFFFVSSVGALSLHYALTAFVSFTGGTKGERAESDHKRDSRDRDHSDLNARLLRAEMVQEQIEHPAEATEQFLHIIANAYLDGLVRGKYKNDGEKRTALESHLVQALNNTIAGAGNDLYDGAANDDNVSRPLFGGNRQQAS